MAAIAHEQLHPDTGLERLDLLRERRRGDVQTRRRPPEVQLLGHGDEVAQLPQFHPAQVTPPY